MPARSERLYVFPERNGAPCRILPFPPWWDRGAFIEKYRKREIDFDNPIDANYVWLLTPGEAIAWNKICMEQFSMNHSGSESTISEDNFALESLLMNASWVIVESYEWESGL